VLIVEDDRAARTAISAILRRKGFAVSEVGTVAEALRAVVEDSATPPQWVLLDLMLPDGCGIDLIRRIRARQVCSRICVITGCSIDMIREAREAGAEHAFTKPLDLAGLMTTMTAAQLTH
jgi:DNA-binding response OmpR family regulator